ncbi:MAG: hypothetical protein O9296_18285 [Novosphingobium sp.]|nr:hypothetical protein [Novosphingobium sp.]
MTDMTLPTANEAWGFYGTSKSFTDAKVAWPIAFSAILKAAGGNAEGVRDFLDSRHGRHFADYVGSSLYSGVDLSEAIEGAVNRWMRWVVDRHTASELSVPTGLPYLKGFVLHFSLKAQAE